MEKRDIEIAAVAASIAAGCNKCLEYHTKKALNAGLTKDDILDIATLAFKIRDKADEYNRLDLDAILTRDWSTLAEDF